ncbi:MAG: hypothetical protein SVC26_08120 [Pseudomonadota bacterium]|nr:hypothetical protein [Pseudomonadota bacterium]
MLVFITALFTAPTQAAFNGLLASYDHEPQWMTHSKPSYTKTQYPLVLAHGLFGFDQIGNLEYWQGIPAELEASGVQVVVTQVAAAVEAFSALISEKSGQSNEQDALAAMKSLTSENAADFNARFPLGVPDKHCGAAPVYAEGMYLFSWSCESLSAIGFVD